VKDVTRTSFKTRDMTNPKEAIRASRMALGALNPSLVQHTGGVHVGVGCWGSVIYVVSFCYSFSFFFVDFFFVLGV
jgi:hypothetical protein